MAKTQIQPQSLIILIIGTKGCGKTSLVERLTSGTFSEFVLSDAIFEKRQSQTDFGETTLIIKEFTSGYIIDSFIAPDIPHRELETADGAIIMIDASDSVKRGTTIANVWYQEIRSVPVVIAVSKSDKTHLTVNYQKLKGYFDRTKREGDKMMFISAKNNINVRKPFLHLLKRIVF